MASVTKNHIHKVEASVAWDYLFTENEILQFEIIHSYEYIPPAFLVFGALFFAGLPGLLNLPSLRAIALPAGVIASLAFVRVLASRKRHRLYSISLSDMLGVTKAKLRIPWSDVTLIEVKGRLLKIRTKKGQYIAKAAPYDVEPLREFIRSKLAEKLIVK